MAELPRLADGQAADFMLLEVRPQVLDGIEFGCVGGEPFGPHASPRRGRILADDSRTVDRRPVPYDQQAPPSEMALQDLEEVHHLRTPDAARVDAEVELEEREAGNHREALPMERLMQHGRLPPWRPGAHPVRTGAQSALVEEDDEALLAARFFLMAGHSTRFQRRMFFSSRSMARRSGRWQLSPKARSIRLR